ncbi:anti-phage deoxyguanosine triphosphatase [Chitiniphilus eburneus]|uniref:Deoxyguanosinetriphosphate triphosphohydrolase-like protein n=1 Tax=Chitiniphilus eburneus TaxID=2571148 RepID=A0A4U0PFB9_9NEIS|nr:anti-phage deoxyguanosine triphosphatase [Chitiniphilus eburneus]TJZ66389.1 deoxyguanosinetriphosphate triphosphohydrolase family protein [Chitiniphilus eburneus]
MIDLWAARRNVGEVRPRDVRSEWERDYARLIHSAAFRRLQSKTQVLGLGESDFYRTRLTHSMEVAQIGVGIVRWLKFYHKNVPEILDALPNHSLMSSICLAHDIGHPPFGHGGEVALNACMRNCGGFEGNGQTLRILSRLDKYTHGYGLNPTRRLMLGVLKYPVSYQTAVVKEAYGLLPTPMWLFKAGEQQPPKCYMDSEQDVVDWILEPLTVEDKRQFLDMRFSEDGRKSHGKPVHKALDTSIMELADDISYSVHDLEDAISLGMISEKDWRQHNAEKEHLFLACDWKIDDLTEQLFARESYRRKQALGDLVHKFIVSVELDFSKISGASNALIRMNARMSEKYNELLNHIFELVRCKVIRSSNVQQLEFKGQKLIVELFEALKSDPERLLPGSTLERYKGVEGEMCQSRVICDFIAGMTDEYAARMYEKLFHPHKGSIFDRL